MVSNPCNYSKDPVLSLCVYDYDEREIEVKFVDGTPQGQLFYQWLSVLS